jgi:hypothetical protein
MAEDKIYTDSDFLHLENTFSWEHHGDFKYTDISTAVLNSNHILRKTKQYLQSADAIIITLGTSLVHCYEDHTVANCHKLPNSLFTQKQLSHKEVSAAIESIISSIRTLNPSATLIFTISPVRHLRSGILQNSRSKAVLMAALHEVLDYHLSVLYFPSFEIFIDELRDYRFAKEDMTHPTLQAETYIWQRFCETYLSVPTEKIRSEVMEYKQLAAHRPIHTADAHHTLVAEKRTLLLKKYPFLKLK